MRHVFTPDTPMVVVPATAPFNRAFTLTPPPNWRAQAGVATRLLHVRTGPGKPRDKEVFELKVGGGGGLVVELSGFGNKQAQFREPLKMPLPPDGRYAVNFADGVVSVNGVTGQTHLKPAAGSALELCFGFDSAGAELVAPIGWTLEADFLPAASGQPPVQPQPPAQPPVTSQAPANPPAQPPAIPPSSPGGNSKDDLRRDLTALALKYAAAQGIDPLILFGLQLLADRVK